MPFRNDAVDLGRDLQKKKALIPSVEQLHVIRHKATRRLWLGKEKHEAGRTYADIRKNYIHI